MRGGGARGLVGGRGAGGGFFGGVVGEGGGVGQGGGGKEAGGGFHGFGGNGLGEGAGLWTIQAEPPRVHRMRLSPRPLLGLLLACLFVLPLAAQKKKTGGLILEAPELPPVPTIPNAFAQVVGTQIISPAYKFTKEDATVEGAREIANFGPPTLKHHPPAPAQSPGPTGTPYPHAP